MLSQWVWRNESGNVSYYGANVTVITPSIAPDYKPGTPSAFMAKVRAHAGQGCVFDFSSFATREDFQRHVEETFPTDLKLSVVSLIPEWISVPRYDAGLRDFLERVFQSRRYVPCEDILVDYD
jgi:hypothetical protein